MVVLMAGDWQPKPFDRVSDEADRPVMLPGSSESFQERFNIVPAEVPHQGCKFLVAAPLDQSRDISLIADVVQEPLAPGGSSRNSSAE